MSKFFYFILVVFLLLSCTSKESDESKISQQETIETPPIGLDYKQPENLKKHQRRAPRIEALFTINKNVLNMKDLNRVTSAFNAITSITFKMIKASGTKQDKLVKQANDIIRKHGYKDLKDYGEHLEIYTWAAGTFLKLQSVDVAFQDNPKSRVSTVLEGSLKRRLKKQKLSTKDLELIRSNWYKIDKVLKTMEEMSLAADKMDQSNQKKKKN